MFEHENKSEPGLSSSRESCFVGAPQVNSVTDCLFGPIVKVIAERADLGLALNGCDQDVLVGHHDIPVLRASIVTRKRNDASLPDRRTQIGKRSEFTRDQLLQGIEMQAAGH